MTKFFVKTIVLVLLVFQFSDASEKKLVLFFDASDTGDKWTSASVAFDKLFYRVKGKETKMETKSINLTNDQLKQIRKLSEKVKKALVNPSPGAIPKGYTKGMMTFSLRLPGPKEEFFPALILEDDKEIWAVATKLRVYLDNIVIKVEPPNEKKGR